MVLLHVIEAPSPVDLRVDLAAHGLVDDVQHLALSLLRIEHPGAAESAAVAGLAAAFGVEGGLFQERGRLAAELAQLDEARAKRAQIRVIQVEPLSHRGIRGHNTQFNARISVST